MLRRDGKADHRMTSWTGRGEIILRPHSGERSTWFDVLIAIALCFAVDLLALGASVVFSQRNGLTVCGARCFDNPRAHIHDNEVTLWAFGIAVSALVVASLVTRRNRIVIVLVQLTVATVVLVNALPDLSTARHRQHMLEQCKYGYAPPCRDVRDLGPGTG